jgi:predicted ester cyclase
MPNPNADYLRRWFDQVWNLGRREAIDEMLPPNCTINEGNMAVTGPGEFKPFFDRMRSAFSNMHIETHEAISEGDMVALRWTATMVHTGEFGGMPPTNKQLTVTGISMARFKNGQLNECWQNWDMLGMVEQIRGAAEPAPMYIAAAS